MYRVYAVSGSNRYGYYLEREMAERAYWIGRAAEYLELKNPVDPREFELLRQGIDPNTGEVLRPRQRHDLWDGWSGKRYAQQRGCYDLVVMAPKSAAIAALYDDRIVEAHKATVWSLHGAVEQHVAVRVRTGAAHETNEYVATQNMVAGVWLHRNSRALDPLLHSHIAVINLTQAPDGIWRALQAVEIYRHREELSEQYRVHMAGELFAMGYRIERREYHGQEVGFEIGGVSEELMQRFSRRSEERDEAIEHYKIAHDGEQPTARTITELVRQNRESKQQFDAEEIRARQMERMEPAEREQLQRVCDQAQTESQNYVPTHRRPSNRLRLDDSPAQDSSPHWDSWTYGERMHL